MVVLSFRLNYFFDIQIIPENFPYHLKFFAQINEINKKLKIIFFKEKDHIFLPAGPLILKEDTTMFCIAGMLL